MIGVDEVIMRNALRWLLADVNKLVFFEVRGTKRLFPGSAIYIPSYSGLPVNIIQLITKEIL